MVPDGFAVPFYFYDEFMKYNGFYEAATAMMADPAFQSDPDVRLGRLAAFRRTIRNGTTKQPVPGIVSGTIATSAMTTRHRPTTSRSRRRRSPRNWRAARARR